MDLQFVNHITAGMAEQDVFIARDGQVVRPEANADKNQPLYAAAQAVPDDPFKVHANPLGPFARGRALSPTLAQWLGANASGTYTVQGDTAELRLSLRGLVPNGSYTVLTPRVSYPPNFAVTPGIAGAPDGSEASFKADAQGNATYSVKMKALPESTKEAGTAIVVVYNSEGAWRGEFGKNEHQQIFAFLPVPSGL
jgi:autotransporter translocation and assembly factor TamB